MSEIPPTPRPPIVETVQNGARGIVGAATAVAHRIIGELPPSFVALLVVNLMFLGLVLWFENTQSAARALLIGKLVDSCVTVIERDGFIRAHEPPP